MHTPYFLNTNRNQTSKTNLTPHKTKSYAKTSYLQREWQQKTKSKPPSTAIHTKVTPNIHHPNWKLLITTPHILIASNNTSHHHYNWVKFPHWFEFHHQSRKTWVKKLTPDLESKAIGPPDSRNKFLRHLSTPRPTGDNPFNLPENLKLDVDFRSRSKSDRPTII